MFLYLGPGSYFYPLMRDKVIFYSLLTYIVYFGLGKRFFTIKMFSLFYMLINTCIDIAHVTVGPWYVGEVLTGVYGLISVHGLYVAGHFLPGSMTYLHGILQVG